MRKGGLFDGEPLILVEDLGYVVADGASVVGVQCGDCLPVLRLEAIQNGLQDRVRIAGEASIGGGYYVDGAASRVLQNAADVPRGLARCVVSAVPSAFSGGGCHAVGVPPLRLVAVGGEERSELGVAFLSLHFAGVL